MIDIHCHLIHGVDDGPSTLDEALDMAYAAMKAGVKTIVATPHYKDDKEFFNRVKENFNELQYRVSNIGLTVINGFEIEIDPFLPNMIEENDNLFMNNTEHILIEFPFNTMPIFSRQTLYNLQLEGVVPIIAHPERNQIFQKHRNYLYKFMQSNIPIQINAGSIIGKYGRKARWLARHLLKKDYVDYIASDAHSSNDYSEYYNKAIRYVEKNKGHDTVQRLFRSNAKDIVKQKSKTLTS